MAYTQFAQAADVKFDLINQLILELEQMNIEAVVAPYEADAQLTHLLNSSIVECVVSEDSDLLAYGCDRVLFKLDTNTGFGVEVGTTLDRCSAFDGLSLEGCQLACILAGCDYGPFLQGVGIRKAIEISKDCERYLKSPQQLNQRLSEVLRLRGIHVNDSVAFCDRVQISRAVFLHQTIFDPMLRGLMPLTQYNPDQIESRIIPFLGPIYGFDKAELVYRGLLHPVTYIKVPRNIGIKGVCAPATASHVQGNLVLTSR
jgi:exonuclease-1